MDVDALLAEMDEAIDGKGKPSAGKTVPPAYKAPLASRTTPRATSKFEEEYKSQPTANSATASLIQPVASGSSRGGKQPMSDDLDSLLSSMDEVISAPSTAAASHTAFAAPRRAAANSATATSPLHAAPPACSPVVLHSASASSLPPCPRLLCLSCDHRVLSIPHWQFAAGADYVFLRTTVPDVEKLRERMERSEGGMGWCCQCMYVNVRSGATVRVDGGRSSKCRWICTGHTNK